MKIRLLRAAPVLVCIALAAVCLSQNADREQRGAETAKAGSCSFSGSGVVPNCVLRDGNGKLSISPTVLKDLNFDRHGLAQVRFEEDSRYRYLWMYVDRNGRVVVSGVPSFDNWADEFSDGLVRIVVGGKYGFANREGRMVIEPAYDWADRYHRGYAMVCNQCREVCAMPGGVVEIQSVKGGCDHTVWVGGEWSKIDKNGRIVATHREREPEPQKLDNRIRVSTRVMDSLISKRVLPQPPWSNSKGHEKGMVTVAVLVGYDGTVRGTSTVSGDPVLAAVAANAIKQWQYRPYIINGEPVQVESRVMVKFSKNSAEVVLP